MKHVEKMETTSWTSEFAAFYDGKRKSGWSNFNDTNLRVEYLRTAAKRLHGEAGEALVTMRKRRVDVTVITTYGPDEPV